MRQYFVVGFLVVALCVNAQINVREHTLQPTSKPYTIKYDCLTNIEKMQDDSITHHRSYKHLIGQYLFYIDEDTNHRGLWVHFTAPL